MIQYKLKNTKDWVCLSATDGGHFTVLELKRQIVKNMSSTSCNFDLEITDAMSGVKYSLDGYIIPFHAMLHIRKIICTNKRTVLFETATKTTEGQVVAEEAQVEKEELQPMVNAKKREQDEEEAKMLKVMSKSVEYLSYGNRSVVYGDGASPPPQRGGRAEFSRFIGNPIRRNAPLAAHYICKRCHQPGHHIRSCPTNGDSAFDIDLPRRATGIPRSFLKRISSKSVGDEEAEQDSCSSSVVALDISKDGRTSLELYQTQPNDSEFKKFFRVEQERKQHTKRTRLCTCLLCNDTFKSRVVTCAYCYSSFCETCLKTHCRENKHLCPICNASIASRDSLIVNSVVEQILFSHLQKHNLEQ